MNELDLHPKVEDQEATPCVGCQRPWSALRDGLCPACLADIEDATEREALELADEDDADDWS